MRRIHGELFAPPGWLDELVREEREEDDRKFVRQQMGEYCPICGAGEFDDHSALLRHKCGPGEFDDHSLTRPRCGPGEYDDHAVEGSSDEAGLERCARMGNVSRDGQEWPLALVRGRTGDK